MRVLLDTNILLAIERVPFTLEGSRSAFEYVPRQFEVEPVKKSS